MGKILLVDDEPSLIWAFRKWIGAMGHEFSSAATAEKGVETARRERPDLIFMDVRLPGKDGLWAVEEIRKDLPDARIVVITAHGTLDTAMKSMKLGAVEYLAKPVDLDKARRLVMETLGTPSREVESLRGESQTDTGIVGKTPAMQEVFRKIAAVSQTDATVLLVGESGTGKELLARAVHLGGPRARGPFEAVNCASIPDTLFESEFFGHEKGAFTDAFRLRKGKLELSDGGSVFLDEIGDLSTAAQAKLLRFLEDRKFTRLGGTESIVVNSRVIAATNQDLEEKVRQGTFREDLYFRLNVMRIDVPPLRARREDIPLLVAHFVEKGAAQGVSDEVMEILRGHPWPGNVRELRNAIERGAVLARGRLIGREHLPDSVISPRSADVEGRVEELVAELLSADEEAKGDIYRRVSERWEKALIKLALRKTGGNRKKASELLGLNRVTFRKRLKKYGLGSGD